MTKLVQMLVRLVLLSSLALFGAACGDDDDDPSSMEDAGGDGDGDGDGDRLTKAQCIDMAEQVASAECVDCTCGQSPDGVADCTEGCWNLVLCMVNECDADITDADCLNQECGEYADRASGLSAMAMLLGPALTECADICRESDGADAGENDGGD